MVQITGRYELIKSENFAAYLIGIGLSEEQAKHAEGLKPVYDFKQDGNKITVDVTADKPQHIEYILNEEVDEILPLGDSIKTTAVLEGNILTLTSKSPEGRTGIRIHKFVGSEIVITYTDADPKIPVATRTLKMI